MLADDTPSLSLASGEAPFLQMRGERVGLGPLRRDLLSLYWSWANDFAYSRTTGSPGLTLSMEQMTRMYDAVVADEHTVSFVIYDQATGQAIGTTALEHIDLRNRTAEFSIGIGEAAYRGKGYGTETTRLMLDYAFTVLGLHNVMLVVYASNMAGQRAYEKAGFREYGRRRESHWMGGRWWDTIYMECLASEFTSPVLQRIFTADEPFQTQPDIRA
jgi:diamine N-acetyltransferase